MNAHFGFAKVAVLAAATLSLLAAPQWAAAQSQGSGAGANRPVPYADSPQGDTNYRTPPPPPAPPPPPPPPAAAGYAPDNDSRYAAPGDQPGYRDAPHPQCRMIEERAFYPDGTTESRPVQACRGPSGRWHVVD